MKNTEVDQVSEKKWVPAVLVLLVGLAAYSTAMKELDQAQTFVTETGNTIASLVGSDMPSTNRHVVSEIEQCTADGNAARARLEEFPWNERVALLSTPAEANELSAEILLEPEFGGEAQITAPKKTSELVRSNSIEPENQHGKRIYVVNRDVGASRLSARTFSNQVARVNSLSANYMSESVRNSVKQDLLTAAAAYPQAAALRVELAAKLRKISWPKGVEIKTQNRVVSLKLPSALGPTIDTESFQLESNPNVLSQPARSATPARSSCPVGSRELQVKSPDGPVHFRRAS